MACDRFVHFKRTAPTHDDVQKILENYFNSCGVIAEHRANWWVITLPGKPSATFAGINGAPAFPRMGHDDPTRWIEVVLEKDNVDVLTRVQDEFVNGIADQLARAFARFYRGKLDMG